MSIKKQAGDKAGKNHLRRLEVKISALRKRSRIINLLPSENEISVSGSFGSDRVFIISLYSSKNKRKLLRYFSTEGNTLLVINTIGYDSFDISRPTIGFTETFTVLISA